MLFAFEEELNKLAIFRRCCSAANLWVVTLSCLSIIGGLIYWWALWLKYWGKGARASSPMKSAPLHS